MTRLVMGSALSARNSPLKPLSDRYNRFFGSFMILCTVFPIYQTLYDLIPVAYRGVAVVILPVWKFTARHFIVRSTRDLEDAMPVLVTLSVDFLSTIFVSVCMSSTKSISLMLLFIAANIAQSLVEFRAMSANGKALLKLLNERRNSHTLVRKNFDTSDNNINLFMIILEATQNSASLPPESLQRVRLWACLPYPLTTEKLKHLTALDSSGVYRSRDDPTNRMKNQEQNQLSIQRAGYQRMRSASITPCAADSGGAEATNPLPEEQIAPRQSQRSREIVAQGVQLLFHSELVALVQYVECIVPIIYLVFKSVLEQLPNVLYYPGGAGNWDTKSVVNLFVFAVLEVALLLCFNTILCHRFGFSPFYQLAFVLETEVHVVQAILFIFILVVLQYELEHFGADFTLRFDWLRGK